MKKINFSNRFSSLIIILSAITIATFWLVEHFSFFQYIYSTQLGFNVVFNIAMPLLFFCLVLFLFLSYIKLKSSAYAITMHISGAHVTIFLFILSWILFNIAAYIRIPALLSMPALDHALWIEHNGAFLYKLTTQFMWIGIIALLTYALGNITLNFLNKKRKYSNVPLDILTSIAYGLWVLVLYLLLISSLGLLNIFMIVLLIGVVCILQIKHLLHYIKVFFTKYSLTLDFRTITPWVVLLALFVLSMTLIDSLRSEPKGFDSQTVYMNKAQLMADEGMLILGGKPFPFEILSSISYVISDTAIFAAGTNIALAIFSFFVIFGITQRITTKTKTALIVATSWLALPMTTHFLYRDFKPDILLFFLTTLAFWLFWEWYQDRKKSNLLFHALFLCGFAITVKLTGILFAITIILSAVIILLCQKKSFKHRYSIFFLSIALFLVGALPWLALSVFSFDPHHPPQKIFHILDSHNKSTPKLQSHEFSQFGIEDELCAFSAMEEDFSRYMYYEKLSPSYVIKMPWRLTMNSNPYVGGRYSLEIGFMFLVAITGIFILYLLKKNCLAKHKKMLKLLTLMSFIYWTTWIMTAQGAPWYGYSGLIFFLLMMAILLATTQQTNKKIYKVLVSLSLLNIVSLICIQVTFFANPYALVNITTSYDDSRTRYAPITDIVNSNSDGLIYMTASQSIYYIKYNYKRVLLDRYLDSFQCLDTEHDDKKTLKRLQDLNVRYFLYSHGIPEMERDPNGSLHLKSKRFLEFAQNSLKEEANTNEFVFYSIPRQSNIQD